MTFKESLITKIIQVLSFEEGYRETAYMDTNGYLTIAGGFKMSNNKNLNPDDFKEFIIPKPVGDLLKRLKIENELLPQMESEFPHLFQHEVDRIAIYASMIYQMGMRGFKRFRNTNRLLKEENFSEASIEMLDSTWAGPVENGGTPERAKRHSSVIKNTSWFREFYGEQ